MEDALARAEIIENANLPISLNPCCNGRCTRTMLACSNRNSNQSVLILVVMEDALALSRIFPEMVGDNGLNPCCNGRCTRTQMNLLEITT